MRVLLYAPAMYPKVDGIALRTRHHLRHLKDMGHQVLVLTPINGTPDIYEGTQVIKLPAFVPIDYQESMISYPFPIFTLIRIMRAFRPDVVHFIGPEFVFIPLALLCKLFDVPIIGSYHFWVDAFVAKLPPVQRLLLGWMGWVEYAYNMSDYVITPSRPMQQILNAKGITCHDIWPPAVDASVFNPSFKSEAMRNLLTWGHPERPLILYVGRVAKEKSMDILLDLLAAHPTAHLAIVGTGPDMPKWKVYHNEASRIFCSCEHWSGDRLSEAYASADVFVIPSAFETLGNVVLESLASGVPVVGCNAGGIPHMLVSDETGYLFEPNDSAALCAAVGRLLYDPELRKRLGDNGVKHVANVSWRAASEYVVDIYKRVIIQHGRPVPGVNAPPQPIDDKGPVFVDPELSYRMKPSGSYAWLAWVFVAAAVLLLLTYAGGWLGTGALL